MVVIRTRYKMTEVRDYCTRYSAHTCGASHAHLPPIILALNGLAGRCDGSLHSGHASGSHGRVIRMYGSPSSQQPCLGP